MSTGSFRARHSQIALFAIDRTHCSFFRCLIASTARNACSNWRLLSRSRNDCWDNASVEMIVAEITKPASQRDILPSHDACCSFTAMSAPVRRAPTYALSADPTYRWRKRGVTISAFKAREERHGVRDQSRGLRSAGEDVHVHRAKDDVWRQAYRGRRHGVRVRERERGRAGPRRGVVTSSEATPKKSGFARQTPRVGVVIKRTARAKRPLGRRELKPFTDWNDGQP